MSFKKIIKKLFDRKFISEEKKDASDYDLLTEIIRKKQKTKESLKKIDKENSQMDAFLEIIEDTENLYTVSEIHYLYNSLISEEII
ncbi:hypothetical protein AWE51_00050 [Aquimarina aggregata]|uniref:Uncharacterized protein n=1 Tax=Aquimarina aggregata TaxID=1642818 RepID=A0A163BXG8_9FLAO|nr:hypothetical protein [Aquimarina aggregata]KZS41872.1 hypothetical protein AWE51_00050 [Aquimarina aggregata]